MLKLIIRSIFLAICIAGVSTAYAGVTIEGDPKGCIYLPVTRSRRWV